MHDDAGLTSEARAGTPGAGVRPHFQLNRREALPFRAVKTANAFDGRR